MGILAGKWPHTLALQPGGSSRPVHPAEKVQLFVLLGLVAAGLAYAECGANCAAVCQLPEPALIPGPQVETHSLMNSSFAS